MAHIGDMQKPSSLVVKGPRLQLPTSRYWHSCVEGKQASVHTCGQRKGDGCRVLSSVSEMAFRSRGLQSKQKIGKHSRLCRFRLKYNYRRSLV